MQHGMVDANGEALGCGLRPQSLAVGVLDVDVMQHGIVYANGEALGCGRSHNQISMWYYDTPYSLYDPA
jgi:hypothetical protein